MTETSQGTKMEIMLPYANKKEAEELANFLENLNPEQQRDFSKLIAGANLVRKITDGTTEKKAG